MLPLAPLWRWRLLLALRAPRAKVNPGTSDAERTLFHDRVHALGTVVPSSLNHRIDTGHRTLDAFRERIAAHIDARVADRDASALTALWMGVVDSLVAWWVDHPGESAADA